MQMHTCAWGVCKGRVQGTCVRNVETYVRDVYAKLEPCLPSRSLRLVGRVARDEGDSRRVCDGAARTVEKIKDKVDGLPAEDGEPGKPSAQRQQACGPK